MRRFIIISLLLSMAALRSVGCMWSPTHNYYLFCCCNPQCFQDYVYKTCDDNWNVYTDGALEYGYSSDKIIEVARQKGDALMVSYVNHLDSYLDICREIMYAWEYPTKEELAERNQQLRNIKAYAQQKLTTRLRSQHALLLMRCNMLLELHQENIDFWEQTASQYIETVYKDMMKNIYAGALLHRGRKAEAIEVFAAQGDYQSLYTYYYKGRSANAITREYEENPNSPVLPFLLQDFANNAQEAYDAEHELGMEGKLFIRNISHDEAMQMRRLAQRVLKEGKTRNPALWKSEEAWLTWLFGNRRDALAMINQAVTMEGTEQSLENARVLQLFMRYDQGTPGPEYDRQLAAELQWLEQRTKETGGEMERYGMPNHYFQVFDRLIHQVLIGKYDRAGRSEVSTALLAVYDHDGYSSALAERMDTLTVAQVEAYASYNKTTPSTPLHQWLTAHTAYDDTFMHEFIATKYLRQAQWDQAIAHLKQVPLSFVGQQAIAVYMAARNYKVEPWMKRQNHETADDASGLRSSQKLDFANEMKQMEADYQRLTGEARAQQAYQLAVRNMQACVYGDAWYLTRYGKSCMDSLRTDEVDWLARADALLDVAAQSSNFQLREKALFAKAFLPGDPWQEQVWNDQTYEFEWLLRPRSHQYRALTVLLDFEQKNATRTSGYVSRCDVLKQFKKQARR